jgi:hypothetical protein
MPTREQLVQLVEDELDTPHDPIQHMDAIAWSTAIRSQWPAIPVGLADSAGAVLQEKYWKGAR